MSKITVNDNVVEWNDGLTITELLKIMKYTFPMLIVKVNGELIRKDQYGTYLVPENSDVKVVHLMSGG
ncbi:MAG: sulfur carrier protein ThiS [Candidatus Delongbacteria bacterium]|nr:sulfur carrier protein ThiS [Candidatus Delongbacteria bacterium]